MCIDANTYHKLSERKEEQERKWERERGCPKWKQGYGHVCTMHIFTF